MTFEREKTIGRIEIRATVLKDNPQISPDKTELSVIRANPTMNKLSLI
jgi:hypothetical protein